METSTRKEIIVHISELKLFRCTIYQSTPDMECYVLAKDVDDIHKNITTLSSRVRKYDYGHVSPDYDILDVEPIDIDENLQNYCIPLEDENKYFPYLLNDLEEYEGKFTISDFVDMKNELFRKERGDRGIIEEGQMSFDDITENDVN